MDRNGGQRRSNTLSDASKPAIVVSCAVLIARRGVGFSTSMSSLTLRSSRPMASLRNSDE